MSGLTDHVRLAEPILVTGATGFLGSKLAQRLAMAGQRVRALHRSTSDLSPLAGLDLELCQGDLLDPASLRRASEGAKTIIHCGGLVAGWRRAAPLHRSHVSGTRHLLTAAREQSIERFLHVSSVAALGLPWPDDDRIDAGMREDHTWNGDGRSWPYAYAKHLAEVEVHKAVGQGLDAVIVCPSAIFGPGDIKRKQGGILARVVDGRLPPIAPAGGLNVVHLDDVLDGILAAWQRGQTGQRYLLTGHNLTHYDLLVQLAHLAGRRPPRWRLPSTPLRLLGSLAVALPDGLPIPARIPMLRLAGLHFYYDNRASLMALGLPQPKGVAHALRDAHAWHVAAQPSPADRKRTAPAG